MDKKKPKIKNAEVLVLLRLVGFQLLRSFLSIDSMIIIASLLGTWIYRKNKEMLSTKVSAINPNCQIENVSIGMAHDFISLSINSKTNSKLILM